MIKTSLTLLHTRPPLTARPTRPMPNPGPLFQTGDQVCFGAARKKSNTSPSVFRSEGVLTPDMIAEKQLAFIQPVTASDIQALMEVASPDPKNQALVGQVLDRMTQFGNEASLNGLVTRLNKWLEAPLFVDQQSALGDSLYYLAKRKGTFQDVAPGFARNIEDIQSHGGLEGLPQWGETEGALLLDDLTLTRLEANPELVRHIANHDFTLFYPESWLDGITLFTPRQQMLPRLKAMMAKVQALQADGLPQDKAIQKALDSTLQERLKNIALSAGLAPEALLEKLTILEHPDRKGNPAIDPEALARRLAPKYLTNQTLKAIMTHTHSDDRPPLMEFLDRVYRHYPARNLAEKCQEQHQHIRELAQKLSISPDKIYFYFPTGTQADGLLDFSYKSNGMATMVYRQVNQIPAKNVLNRIPDELARDPSAMVVLVDDFSGTGIQMLQSMRHYFLQNVKGPVVFAPLIHSAAARRNFEQTQKGYPNHHWVSTEQIPNLQETDFFKTLSEADKIRLYQALGKEPDPTTGQYSPEDLICVSLWNMSPDNNPQCRAIDRILREGGLLNEKGHTNATSAFYV